MEHMYTKLASQMLSYHSSLVLSSQPCGKIHNGYLFFRLTIEVSSKINIIYSGEHLFLIFEALIERHSHHPSLG